jgi:hypothetical protein
VYVFTGPMPTEQSPIFVVVPVDDKGTPLASRAVHSELKRVVGRHPGRAVLVYAVRDRYAAYRRAFGY